MIKDLESMNLEAHVKDDVFDNLVNYITEIKRKSMVALKNLLGKGAS